MVTFNGAIADDDDDDDDEVEDKDDDDETGTEEDDFLVEDEDADPSLPDDNGLSSVFRYTLLFFSFVRSLSDGESIKWINFCIAVSSAGEDRTS